MSSRPAESGLLTPLADPIAEARRLIDDARAHGLAIRALGGVAVCMRSPGALFPREVKDIDLAAAPRAGAAVGRLLQSRGYLGEEMFNALRGSRRQLFHDPVNRRNLDVFVGSFAMCHTIPLAPRLDNHPYTIPIAELLMTKLQIVELAERDQRDIYVLCHDHDLTDGGIEADVIAAACAADWGLWRTCTGTIERCRDDLDRHTLLPAAQQLIDDRLRGLRERIDATRKRRRWRRRAIIGELVRWYAEPEEEGP